jgi:hypothetical protein
MTYDMMKIFNGTSLLIASLSIVKFGLKLEDKSYKRISTISRDVNSTSVKIYLCFIELLFKRLLKDSIAIKIHLSLVEIF